MSSEDSVDEVIVTKQCASVESAKFCGWNFKRIREHHYRCNRCLTTVKSSSGYQNLLAHCKNTSCWSVKGPTSKGSTKEQELKWRAAWQVPWAAFHKAQIPQGKELGKLLFSATPSLKAKTYFDWINFIIARDEPLSVVEDATVRQIVKMSKVSRKTIRAQIIKLAEIVKLKIKKEIGKGCCVADGWDGGTYHYTAVVHSWPVRVDREDGYMIQIKQALLSIAPLLDQSKYDAKSHADSIKEVYNNYLSVEQKDNGTVGSELIVAFTLDNCSMNHAMVRDHFPGTPMIGAHCHRLNLACAKFTQEAFDKNMHETVKQVQAVIKKASTHKGRGILRQLDSAYEPRLNNATRWQGVAELMISYERLEAKLVESNCFDNDSAALINVGDGAAATPTILRGARKNDFYQKYLPAARDLKKFLAQIQGRDLDLSDTAALFRTMLQNKHLKGQSPEFEARLQPNHDLVRFPDFEQGVVKILENESEKMSEEEQIACKGLWRSKFPKLYPEETSDVDIPFEVTGSPGCFERIRQQKKKLKVSNENRSIYVDCRFLTPTTVVVERLFSSSARVLTANRCLMHPNVFDAIMCLRFNRAWWDQQTVSEMEQGEWDEELGQVYSAEQFCNAFDEDGNEW